MPYEYEGAPTGIGDDGYAASREDNRIDAGDYDDRAGAVNQPHTPAGTGNGAAKAIIEAVDLVKDYGSGGNAVHALRHVNVQFGKGQFTAIMGPSGSGKSTLMHVLSGLDTATSGTVLLEGRDITHLKDNELTALRRDSVGFVFQSFNLLPMFTAQQNITLPLTLAGKKIDTTWLNKLANQLGIADRLDHRPSELSGGQQQRVAIARALIAHPAVVFADEPTGALDTVSSAEVLAMLRQLVTDMGQTVIMVTHDASAAAYADRAIVFADGQIVADIDNPTADGMERIVTEHRWAATEAAAASAI